MNNQDINIELLPANLRDIAENERLGWAVAMKLVENYGGTRVWIPAEVEHSHHLVINLGREKAQQLCFFYALNYVSIEKAEKALRVLRDRKIVGMLDEGATVVHVALEFSLTERQVYNIKRISDADEMATNQSELW